jgi:glucose-6-phosphate isomerase
VAPRAPNRLVSLVVVGHIMEIDAMEAELAAKVNRLDGQLALWGGPIDSMVEEACARLDREGFLSRLFEGQPGLWSAEPSVQAKIANRLGWLRAPDAMLAEIDRLRRFAGAVRAEGTTDVVLLGMGGSSLAPEVTRRVLGVVAGWPRFHMLDSTDPAAIAAIDPPVRTSLFILASKSGGTIEPNSLAAHYRARIEAAGTADWARQFVAITDEGTGLHRRAVADEFREVFVNPADIGGRYSALSLFGLVPAALMGHDPGELIDWGRAMLRLCGAGRKLAIHPAVPLGVAMAIGAKTGRDKLTLNTPPLLEPFGLWVEQLVAESTGKQGTGVVPIAGERIGPPEAYGSDRLFVHMEMRAPGDEDAREAVHALAGAGSPLVQILVPEPAALFAEFVRWEVATAVAGAVMEVNPFDEPNVQQAKDMTRRLLEAFSASGRLEPSAAEGTIAGARLALTRAARTGLGAAGPQNILSLVRPGDYCAILAYLGPDPALGTVLEQFRLEVRDRSRAATTFGYGPRYLHSTGQLHKGGANSGVFIVVTADPVTDLPIPGEEFSFATLEHAQAYGDFASLDQAQRRGLHVHLPRPDPTLLEAVCAEILKALPAGRGSA